MFMFIGMKIESASTWLARIGITTLAWAGMVASARFFAAGALRAVAALAAVGGIVTAGCGAPTREARSARAQAYDADYAEVYNQVMAAVAEDYPDFVAENAGQGEIRTPWFPVGLVSEPGASPRASPGASIGASGRGGVEEAPPTRFYVRFDIQVTGGRPWRVHVRGQASAWELGQPLPEVLDGPEEPPWLQGRIDALQVAIHRRLARHAVAAGADTAAQANQGAGAGTESTAEPVPAHLADLPVAAARAALAVQRAAEARDLDRLAGLLHEQLTWSPGAPPDARMAVGVWRADPAVLTHLAAAIAAGCRAAPRGQDAGQDAGQRVVCPAAAAEPGFAGYRAELAPAPDGRWKLAAFFTH